MAAVNPLSSLIEQLGKLPGVGPKSAQRMAFHLLSRPVSEVELMGQVMVDVRRRIKYCATCFNISFQEKCHLCLDDSRHTSLLCVVAEPKDIFAMEKTGEFDGVYHVLGGLLSPIDGIHPETLRIQELLNRIKTHVPDEILFAINPTIEGDATVLYLSNLLKDKSIKLSRLAFGLPMGADIDYADEVTLQRAFVGRNRL